MADRTGLYIMVFLTMMNSCSASIDADKAVKTLKQLSDELKAKGATLTAGEQQNG